MMQALTMLCFLLKLLLQNSNTCMINRTLYLWPFHMNFKKPAKGLFQKFHIKLPHVQGSLWSSQTTVAVHSCRFDSKEEVPWVDQMI